MSVYINSLRNGSCPCGGCEERTLGCHSSCEKYQNWKGSRDAIRNGWRKENGGSSEAELFEIQSKTKMKAEKHRRRRR